MATITTRDKVNIFNTNIEIFNSTFKYISSLKTAVSFYKTSIKNLNRNTSLLAFLNICKFIQSLTTMNFFKTIPPLCRLLSVVIIILPVFLASRGEAHRPPKKSGGGEATRRCLVTPLTLIFVSTVVELQTMV